MAHTGGYRRSVVWRPCGVMPHAALQNKSVVCSGSRVTISTVMKLRWSVKRGGIIVETYTKSTCSQYNNTLIVKLKDIYGAPDPPPPPHTGMHADVHSITVTLTLSHEILLLFIILNGEKKNVRITRGWGQQIRSFCESDWLFPIRACLNEIWEWEWWRLTFSPLGPL